MSVFKRLLEILRLIGIFFYRLLPARKKGLVDLRHKVAYTKRGAMVLLLDRGEIISPEDNAMLMALHSRSTGGVLQHLDTLIRKGSERFMAMFYLGYGHKSIGDMAMVSLFIEGVSMLVAKAVQGFPLYAGQESSTRFIPFDKQKFENPSASAAAGEVLELERRFYLKIVQEMEEELKRRYPIAAEEKPADYKKAISARAFDIARGFLPAGATTNVAWEVNFRQLNDRLSVLRHHPLSEVREVAEVAEALLMGAYPSSFSGKRYARTEEYLAAIEAGDSYWFEADCPAFEYESRVDKLLLNRRFRRTLAIRPPKAELPKRLAVCGEVSFRFILDFASFRDLQRHRAVNQLMPLLSRRLGFNEWYLGELTPGLKAEALALLEGVDRKIAGLGLSPEEEQYYIPMGYNTSCRLSGDLPALVYLVELRATRFVHPTLRRRALQMAAALEDEFAPCGLVLHLDPDPDRFDVKRGTHDIVTK